MRRIGQCLNTKLTEIYQQAVKLDEFNAKLSDYLPATFHDHCHVGSFSKGCLIIVADNAAWASQLRYCVPELRDRLRSDAGIYKLTSIKVTVAATEQIKVLEQKSKLKLSKKARDAIIASGDQCSYEPLKQALLHLGSSVVKQEKKMEISHPTKHKNRTK